MEHTPLKTEFKSKGFLYKQICREGDFAIYSQEPLSQGWIRFETVIIRRHNGYEIAGHFFPPAEMYPSISQWGSLGWTYHELEDAKKRLAKLVAASREGNNGK